MHAAATELSSREQLLQQRSENAATITDFVKKTVEQFTDPGMMLGIIKLWINGSHDPCVCTIEFSPEMRGRKHTSKIVLAHNGVIIGYREFAFLPTFGPTTAAPRLQQLLKNDHRAVVEITTGTTLSSSVYEGNGLGTALFQQSLPMMYKGLELFNLWGAKVIFARTTDNAKPLAPEGVTRENWTLDISQEHGYRAENLGVYYNLADPYVAGALGKSTVMAIKDEVAVSGSGVAS